MTERRPSIGPFAHLLAKAVQPVYVVDAKRRLIWCNPAFLDFFGASAEAIIGQECLWAPPEAEREGGSAVSKLLRTVCPSPEVFAGNLRQGEVLRQAADGSLQSHRVTYVPLYEDSGGFLGVVGIIDPTPQKTGHALSLAPVEAPEGPQDWHLRLHRFLQEESFPQVIEALIGTSPRMEQARRQFRAICQCQAHVLIAGPPGTGRRQVAQAIHSFTKESARSICVTLGCDILGGEVVYSTFLASMRFRPGPGELPIGTILLVNADTLTQEVQAELAKLMADPGFHLRVVATSVEPLVELANRGKADLHFASLVSTLVIELPPLVGRPEDIPLLAQYFLEKCNSTGDKQIGGFTPEALDWLLAYHWPGNVAEMQALITEIHRRASGPLVRAEDLPERIYFAVQAAKFPTIKEESIQLEKFLLEVRDELLRRALAKTKGNKARAARLLGITRASLLRLLGEIEKPKKAPAPPRVPKARPHLPALEVPSGEPEELLAEELPTFEELDNSEGEEPYSGPPSEK
jgi:transcriptional regulator with PAS, ATPase and Fis domain